MEGIKIQGQKGDTGREWRYRKERSYMEGIEINIGKEILYM